MRRGLWLPLIFTLAVLLPVTGCGDDEGTTIDEDGSAVDGANTTVTGTTNVDEAETAPEIPDDIDFEAMGEEFVAAAAAGDCEKFADLQGWSEEDQNRETSIANCALVTDELADLGEPTATSTREEALAEDEVQVHVTRDFADGSRWEMQMIIRKSTAVNRDEGWVVSTYSY